MSHRLTLLVAALALLIPFDSTCWADAAPHNFAKWEKEIAAFEASDQANPPPKGAILFVGSSSIRKWRTLAQDFPQHRVINRGFGGSEIIDGVHFADRIVVPYAPRLIVFYAGGNDIHAGTSPDQVFENFKAFAAKVRSDLPETNLDYISIAGNPARWAEVDKVRDANAKIQAFMEGQTHLKFINVFPKMMGEDGLPRPEIFSPDKLHMNARGYALWTSIIRPLLPPPDL